MSEEEKNKLILDNCSKEGLAQGWCNEFLKRKYLQEEYEQLQQKVEQLENIRKEAIEWVTNHKEELHHSFDEPDWDYLLYGNATDLLNILNKGSDK